MAGVAAQLGINVPGSVNQKMIYPQIIKSRTLASRMLQKNLTVLNLERISLFKTTNI